VETVVRGWLGIQEAGFYSDGDFLTRVIVGQKLHYAGGLCMENGDTTVE
jgi:hypothetical protein